MAGKKPAKVVTPQALVATWNEKYAPWTDVILCGPQGEFLRSGSTVGHAYIASGVACVDVETAKLHPRPRAAENKGPEEVWALSVVRPARCLHHRRIDLAHKIREGFEKHAQAAAAVGLDAHLSFKLGRERCECGPERKPKS